MKLELIRENIFKLLENETKFNQGDTVATQKDGDGIVLLAKHPYYSIQLNNTGVTKSYHFTDLNASEPIESEFGKYELDEITINKPFQKYKIQCYHNSFPYTNPIEINGSIEIAKQKTIEKLNKDGNYNTSMPPNEFWAIIYLLDPEENKSEKEVGRVKIIDNKFQFYQLPDNLNESSSDKIVKLKNFESNELENLNQNDYIINLDGNKEKIKLKLKNIIRTEEGNLYDLTKIYNKRKLKSLGEITVKNPAKLDYETWKKMIVSKDPSLVFDILKKYGFDNSMSLPVFFVGSTPQEITKTYAEVSRLKGNLYESSSDKIVKLDGILTIDEDIFLIDILSNIRSLTGITTVRNNDIKNEDFKTKLNIKIDPYPFGDQGTEKIQSILIKKIKQIPGVRDFYKVKHIETLPNNQKLRLPSAPPIPVSDIKDLQEITVNKPTPYPGFKNWKDKNFPDIDNIHTYELKDIEKPIDFLDWTITKGFSKKSHREKTIDSWKRINMQEIKINNPNELKLKIGEYYDFSKYIGKLAIKTYNKIINKRFYSLEEINGQKVLWELGYKYIGDEEFDGFNFNQFLDPWDGENVGYGVENVKDWIKEKLIRKGKKQEHSMN